MADGTQIRVQPKPLVLTGCGWSAEDWSLLRELGFGEIKYRALNPSQEWSPRAPYMEIYMKACREGVR